MRFWLCSCRCALYSARVRVSARVRLLHERAMCNKSRWPDISRARLRTQVPHVHLPHYHTSYFLLARKCAPITKWIKNIWWWDNSLFITGKNEVPGIREIIIYHYIIYELLSQHYWGGASLEEHVQLGLYYCNKWHNILLVGHCQKSIHSVQKPIIHVGLSMLAL